MSVGHDQPTHSPNESQGHRGRQAPLIRRILAHPAYIIPAGTALLYVAAQSYTAGFLKPFGADPLWFTLSLVQIASLAWPAVVLALVCVLPLAACGRASVKGHSIWWALYPAWILIPFGIGSLALDGIVDTLALGRVHMGLVVDAVLWAAAPPLIGLFVVRNRRRRTLFTAIGAPDGHRRPLGDGTLRDVAHGTWWLAMCVVLYHSVGSLGFSVGMSKLLEFQREEAALGPLTPVLEKLTPSEQVAVRHLRTRPILTDGTRYLVRRFDGTTGWQEFTSNIDELHIMAVAPSERSTALTAILHRLRRLREWMDIEEGLRDIEQQLAELEAEVSAREASATMSPVQLEVKSDDD